MIVSHKYRFIFVKTKKTAGTSIEVFLSQCCGEHDIVTPIHPHVPPHVPRNYRGLWNPLPDILGDPRRGPWAALKRALKLGKFYNHIPARALRRRLPRRVWREYFKFCVERNPWDKTLSHYHMLNDLAGGSLTLDEYLARGSFCLNYPKYTDDGGGLMLDRVIKYESLTDGLAEVFRQLGIPFNGTLGVRAKSEHRTDRQPYQQVFNDAQRQVIERAFAREIEMHGYTF